MYLFYANVCVYMYFHVCVSFCHSSALEAELRRKQLQAEEAEIQHAIALSIAMQEVCLSVCVSV
jgi:hypothetical protein